MSKNKECVRCGGDTGYLLKSLIVSTHQVCINCFEEEMIEPKKVKQRLREEKLRRLGYTQEYLGGGAPRKGTVCTAEFVSAASLGASSQTSTGDVLLSAV